MTSRMLRLTLHPPVLLHGRLIRKWVIVHEVVLPLLLLLRLLRRGSAALRCLLFGRRSLGLTPRLGLAAILFVRRVVAVVVI